MLEGFLGTALILGTLPLGADGHDGVMDGSIGPDGNGGNSACGNDSWD